MRSKTGLQLDYEMDYNWITIGLRNELHKHEYSTKSGLQLDYGCLTKTQHIDFRFGLLD